MRLAKSLLGILAFIIILLLANAVFGNDDVESDETNDTNLIDEVVFPHDEVIDVNIEISDTDYQYLLDNATNEEYVVCDITYNGYTINSVAIRAKGNSSLRDVYQDGDDRFSFKIDFDYYIDSNNLFGIEKLNLNNLFMDPSMMAEYIGYEALDSLDAVSARTTFTSLSINGEYYGIYLSVEDVNDEFLEDNYDNSDGYLYKPEMGTGADLGYVSDDESDYTGLFPENTDDYTNDSILALITAIENGDDLDNILNVDSFLKYLAVSTYLVHLDSYQGAMYHNYYLYDNDGIYEWISWDLNMIFNGFPGVNMTDAQATEFLIDEPVKGSLSNYPLVEAVLANVEYLELYHSYLEELMDNYLESDTFNARVLEIYNMIDDYVKADTNSFYSYEEFGNALFGVDASSLTGFVELRGENISKQLSGELVSTNNGLGGITTITDTNTGTGTLPPLGEIPDGQVPTGDRPTGDRPTGDIGDREVPTDVIGNQQGQGNLGLGNTLDEDIVNAPGETTISQGTISTIILATVGTIGAIIYLSLKKFS